MPHSNEVMASLVSVDEQHNKIVGQIISEASKIRQSKSPKQKMIKKLL